MLMLFYLINLAILIMLLWLKVIYKWTLREMLWPVCRAMKHVQLMLCWFTIITHKGYSTSYLLHASSQLIPCVANNQFLSHQSLSAGWNISTNMKEKDPIYQVAVVNYPQGRTLRTQWEEINCLPLNQPTLLHGNNSYAVTKSTIYTNQIIYTSVKVAPIQTVHGLQSVV